MRANVSVFTTHYQMEQPISINNVVALSFVAGALLIEAEVEENGYSFNAFHRFDPDKWTRISVSNYSRGEF